VPRLTNLPPSAGRLSRQSGTLNMLQPYRPLQPVTGMALLFFLENYNVFSMYNVVRNHDTGHIVGQRGFLFRKISYRRHGL
jgi:hypothetical protein